MRRSAFTLVEMLIVLGIMLLLAAITVSFLPNRDVRTASNCCDALQTMLASARSKALRDNTPTGIRFLQDASGNITSCQIVQKPDNLCPYNVKQDPLNPTMYLNMPANSVWVQQVGYDISSVSVGDYLEIMEWAPGSSQKILAVDPSTGWIQLSTVPPVSLIAPTKLIQNYRYIRQPKPLLGEAVAYQFPMNVVVLPNGSQAPASQNLPGNLEIVFAPSGKVLGKTAEKIVIWIDTINGVNVKPMLLCVYAGNGQVSYNPLGPVGNEYKFVSDGQSSGQ